MTIQETIIEALKASQSAHTRGLATIAGLRADNGNLEAEVVRLTEQVAILRAQIAHMQNEAQKIVEPASVQSLLSSLRQVVEETQQATSPASAGPAPAVASDSEPYRDEQRYDEPSPPPSLRPMLRQILDRDFSAQEVAEAVR